MSESKCSPINKKILFCGGDDVATFSHPSQWIEPLKFIGDENQKIDMWSWTIWKLGEKLVTLSVKFYISMNLYWSGSSLEAQAQTWHDTAQQQEMFNLCMSLSWKGIIFHISCFSHCLPRSVLYCWYHSTCTTVCHLHHGCYRNPTQPSSPPATTSLRLPSTIIATRWSSGKLFSAIRMHWGRQIAWFMVSTLFQPTNMKESFAWAT